MTVPIVATVLVGLCLVPAFFLPEAIEALVGIGDLDRADRVLAMLLDRGRELDRVWALATGQRCLALLRAARGDVDGALAAAADALTEHERIELPFDRARALLVRGVIQRRARRRAEARRSLEQALGEFERIGTPRLADRAREELARTGQHRSGDQLTESEQRTAELAASGLTNREIAAALFVSPKTVEANLARAYRKLEISSRAELGARMGQPRTS